MIIVDESIDLVFEVWLNLKNDFYLWRVVKISLAKGISIRIYSGDDLAVLVQQDDLDVEYAYLLAAKQLINWAVRNEDHASSSTKKGDSEKWVEKLKEQLGAVDEINHAAKGWEMFYLSDE